MSQPSIAWTEQVARQGIDKFLRAWGRPTQLGGGLEKWILLKSQQASA